jgi:hypothetical protein
MEINALRAGRAAILIAVLAFTIAIGTATFV